MTYVITNAKFLDCVFVTSLAARELSSSWPYFKRCSLRNEVIKKGFHRDLVSKAVRHLVREGFLAIDKTRRLYLKKSKDEELVFDTNKLEKKMIRKLMEESWENKLALKREKSAR